MANPGRRLVVCFTGVLALAARASAVPLPPPVEYAAPAGSIPVGITRGADGALWFAERGRDRVGRITTAGAVSEIPAPPGFFASQIAVGSDGALWLTNGSERVGRIDPDLVGAESILIAPGAAVIDIALGADGAMWASDIGRSAIVRLATEPDGFGGVIPTVVNTFSLGFSSAPLHVAQGADGALWWTDVGRNRIGRIGYGPFTIDEVGLPTITTFAAALFPFDITAGPDGANWFTNPFDRTLRPTTAAGLGAAVPLGASAFELATGSDGALWAGGVNRILRATPGGDVSTLLASIGIPGGVTAGPDGGVWFTEPSRDRIARLATLATFLVERDPIDPKARAPFSGHIAHIVDGTNPNAPPSAYSALIDWGDGQQPSSGQVTSTNVPGVFDVSGNHTYAARGDYPLAVLVVGPQGDSAFARDVALVQPSEVLASGRTLDAVRQQPFVGTVATFVDVSQQPRPPSAYTATIDWGDGSQAMAAQIAQQADGSYAVVGAKTYSRRGAFNIAVDVVGPGGGCDVALSAARVRNRSGPEG